MGFLNQFFADVFNQDTATPKKNSSFEKISNEAVVSHLEDGGLGVGIDSHDGLAVLHTRKVLNGSTDADCDVEVRRNYLARLAYLHVVRNIAGINRCARGSNCRVELVR